jgi:hypothetical protein
MEVAYQLRGDYGVGDPIKLAEAGDGNQQNEQW